MQSTESAAPGRVLVALGAAVVACALEISMLFPTLPALVRTFGDPSNVFWTVTIHYLMAASSVALSGRLGDLYGRKRVMLVVMTIALLGSLLSLSSTSLLGIIIGRGIQGISAAVIPLAFGIVREVLPPLKVPLGIAVVATIAPVTGGIGVLFGGILIDHAPWRTLFGVSAVWMLLAIGLVSLLIPSRPAVTSRKIDILGGVLLPPAIASLLLGIEGSRHWGWTDLRTLGLMATSAVLLLIWYRRESTHHDPLIDVKLLRNRQIGLANLGMALFGLGALQNSQILSLLLQQPSATGVGLGISATKMGALFMPFIVLNLVGGPLSGRIAARSGGRRAALMGMSLTAIGWTGIAVAHEQLWFVMVMAYTQTLGIAMLFAALANLVVEVAPLDRTSEATGILSVTRQFAASIGAQVIAFTLSSSTVSDPNGGAARFPSNAAFALVLGYVAIVCIVAVILTSLLPRRAPAVATTTPGS